MELYERTWEELFADELTLLSNGMRTLTLKVLDKVEPQHKRLPASSTGKYHPQFAQGEGGLIRHTKAMVWYAIQLLRARDDLSVHLEQIIVASILHDMAKYAENTPHTRFDHPEVMASLFTSVCETEEYSGVISADTDVIRNLIACHMGQWNTSKRSSTVLATPINDLQWLVHYADYLASRIELNLEFTSDWRLAI